MFASILASVNLFLALFNLVPLPPLDGGHIVEESYDAQAFFEHPQTERAQQFLHTFEFE